VISRKPSRASSVACRRHRRRRFGRRARQRSARDVSGCHHARRHRRPLPRSACRTSRHHQVYPLASSSSGARTASPSFALAARSGARFPPRAARESRLVTPSHRTRCRFVRACDARASAFGTSVTGRLARALRLHARGEGKPDAPTCSRRGTHPRPRGDRRRGPRRRRLGCAAPRQLEIAARIARRSRPRRRRALDRCMLVRPDIERTASPTLVTGAHRRLGARAIGRTRTPRVWGARGLDGARRVSRRSVFGRVTGGIHTRCCGSICATRLLRERRMNDGII
jgi:hypothetical protein